MDTRIKKILKWTGSGIAVLGSVAAAIIFSSKSEDENLYSSDWFSSASDDELDIEREKVRLQHCDGDENAWNLLNRFDNEISKRAWDGKEYGYPVHREHGWYLSNDDD